MAMEGYYTYAQEPSNQAMAQRCTEPLKPKIAVVTQGVKLGDETRGYSRFRFICELLIEQGFGVELITSSFQHWNKSQRSLEDPSYKNHSFQVTFIDEPGYKRNLDLTRILSHGRFAKNLKEYFRRQFAENPKAYSLIYCEIPPNDMARVCGEIAKENNVPFVVDINDLWPEAMRMALDVPLLSGALFAPFARDAKKVYNLIDAAVGTSEEYATRPSLDRKKPYVSKVVYVGNKLTVFDEGAQRRACEVHKPEDEIWFIYAGNLGASYDLATLVKAAKVASNMDGRIRLKILGDGPDRPKLEKLARTLESPAEFVGYAPYDLMAAYVGASDVTVNSLIKAAPQSIVTKIGDYLAGGVAMINTGASPEFRRKVETDGFGINVEAEDVQGLAAAMVVLAQDEPARKNMGQKARAIAEEQFDQDKAYLAIVNLIESLL